MADGRNRPDDYSETGPLAVGARLSLVLLVIAIVVGSLIPTKALPRLLASAHLEHFAAFYLLTLATAAACPRTQLRRILFWLMSFAVALEAARILFGARPISSVEELFADIGGMWSALVPIVIGRFRDLLGRRRAGDAARAA
jgi:hypothetical protein